MNYTLMHGNIEVATVQDRNHIDQIMQVEEMPVGVWTGNSSKAIQDARFANWLRHRTIPNGRIFAEYLRASIGCSFDDMMFRCLSVSITDTYWLRPEGRDLTWEQINYHDNLFSNEVSKSLLLRQNAIVIDTPHPSFTTDGMLEKTWILLNRQPYLLKFDEQKEQMIGEVYASRVAELLQVPHVKYEHIMTGNRHSVICPCLITDSHTDMVHAMQYSWHYQMIGRRLFEQLYQQDPVGITNMITFDSLTRQEDRHEFNFAFAGSKMLPLYDSGRCLSVSRDTKPFLIDWQKQLHLIPALPFVPPEVRLLTELYEEVCEEFQTQPQASALRSIQEGCSALRVRYDWDRKQKEVEHDGYKSDFDERN